MLHPNTGHFTYECKSTRPYVSRPSRTAQLENPRLLAKLKADGKPSIEVPEEFKNKFVCNSSDTPYRLKLPKRTGTADKILEAKEKQREIEDKGHAKKKTKRCAFPPLTVTAFFAASYGKTTTRQFIKCRLLFPFVV